MGQLKKNGQEHYNKELISTCDDLMFASGEVILGWNAEKNIPGITLKLDLQYGSTAFLRKSEVIGLINNLKTFLDRLPDE